MFKRSRKTWIVLIFPAILVAMTWSTLPVWSDGPTETQALTPQRLLPLVHSREVQAELQLDKSQVAELESFFRTIDGEWFRSRNSADAERLATVERLERQLWKELERLLPEDRRKRLRQIEMQAQGVRALLRSDVSAAIGLSSEQSRQLQSAAKTTAAAEAAAWKSIQGGEEPAAAQQRVRDAAAAEKTLVQGSLDSRQQKKLSQLLGEAFDTASLKRIYPMAPELIEVPQWLNGPPRKLADLRGKIVLVHFYAFECHNCHANFGHYSRWAKQYGDRVVVIGIQTPETFNERDPAQIASAAETCQMSYPIALDLKSENWKAWSNTMWPTVYVVDGDGYLRFWWQGELNWQGAIADKEIEKLIDQLLTEQTPAS